MQRSVLRPPLAAATPTLLTVLLCVLLAVGWAPPASAHAELVSSTPAAGAGLTEMPARVRLTFSGAVRTPAFVEVSASGGSQVTTGPAHIRGRQVTRRLTSSSPGAFTVAYRVTSSDGHAITGSFQFRLQDADEQGQTDPPATSAATPADESSPTTTGGESPADTATSPAPEQTDETEPVAADDGDGPGGGLVVLLVAVVLVGLAAVGWAVRRALRA